MKKMIGRVAAEEIGVAQRVFELNALAGPEFKIEHGLGVEPRMVSAYDQATSKLLNPQILHKDETSLSVTIVEALGLREIVLIAAA